MIKQYKIIKFTSKNLQSMAKIRINKKALAVDGINTFPFPSFSNERAIIEHGSAIKYPFT